MRLMDMRHSARAKFINVAVYALRLKADRSMSIISKLTESKGFLLVSVFYLVVALLSLVLMAMTGFPPHMGIIGIFSLAAGYGVLMKRSWSLYPIIVLFFVATAFSLYMLYYELATNVLIVLGSVAYLVLSWIATAYVASKRAKLEG